MQGELNNKKVMNATKIKQKRNKKSKYDTPDRITQQKWKNRKGVTFLRPQKFQCQFCGTKYSYQKYYLQHLKKHPEYNPESFEQQQQQQQQQQQ